jgi:hypothetical protein
MPANRQDSADRFRRAGAELVGAFRAPSGSMLFGTLNRLSRSSSQSMLWMLNSMVRLALVTSVACTLPPVRRHSTKLSIGAHGELAALGRLLRARARCPGNQRTLVAEK